MIKVGALCYLTRCRTDLIGRLVTIVGPLEASRSALPDGSIVNMRAYLVEFVGARPSRNPNQVQDWWCAPPINLIPISDPDQAQDERHDERLTA